MLPWIFLIQGSLFLLSMGDGFFSSEQKLNYQHDANQTNTDKIRYDAGIDKQ